jgi:hypothetical protein
VAGADAAYLIVLPSRRGEQQGTVTVGPDLSQSPIRAIDYRNHTCRASGPNSCPPVGFVPVRARVTPGEVAAPIRVRRVSARSYCAPVQGDTLRPCGARVPPGFTRIATGLGQLLVDVSFIARAAVTSSRSYYQFDLHFPKSSRCYSSEISGPMPHDIRAGERVSDQQLVRYSCPGGVPGNGQLHPRFRTRRAQPARESPLGARRPLQLPAALTLGLSMRPLRGPAGGS